MPVSKAKKKLHYLTFKALDHQFEALQTFELLGVKRPFLLRRGLTLALKEQKKRFEKSKRGL